MGFRIELMDADWFGRERAIGYAKMVAIAFVFPLVWFYLQALSPVGSDFIEFWMASKFILAGHPADAYRPAAEAAFTAANGWDHWVPFLCAPPLLALIAPLGLLPYALALPAWVAATYAAWLSVARRLIPAGFWPIAVFPGAMVNAWHAQNGFVTGALFTGAVLTLEARPILAGALLGGLVIKPQLALLVPLALIAGRQWRAFFAAGLSAAVLLALSTATFGLDTLQAFLAAGSQGGDYLANPSRFFRYMPTVFASVDLIAGPAPAIAAQVVATVLAAAAVWWSWSRPAVSMLGKGAVLALATVLATPYLYSYDLVLLIVPVCWFAVEGMASGFRSWERVMLAVLYWTPFLGRAFAEPLRFNVTWPVVAVALGFAVARLRSETTYAAAAIAV